MRKSLTLLFGILISLTSFSQIEEIKTLTSDLCSPNMHGRGYVAGGDSIAAEYIAKEYEKIGLSALPEYDSYFQPFSFDVNTFPGEMALVIDGKTMLAGQDYIVKPSSGSDDIKQVKSRFLTQEEIFNPTVISQVIDSIRSFSSINTVVTNLSRLKGDSLKATQQLLDELTSICAVVELFDKKFTWSVARQASVHSYIYLRDSLWKDSQNSSIEIQNFLKKDHQARNVIGYIPSKKRTKKTVFFTAHYDHLGRMGFNGDLSDKTNAYFPGANDNASGTAMLINLAKYFTDNPQKFNIAFIAFAGEEAGLIGSKYYVEHPIYPLEEIDFLINIDIMGSGEEGITVVNGAVYEKAFKKLTKINKKHDLLTAVKKRGKAANSDHYFFSEAGVPAIFIYTMGPNKHYHDIYDTFDQLTFNEYEDIVELLRIFLKKV